MLFSTTSFGVDKHICMDSVYSSSVFGEADDCGMEMNQCVENLSDSFTLSNEDCCHNTFRFHLGSTTKENSKTELKDQQIRFIAYFIFSTNYSLLPNVIECVSYVEYEPPIVVRDISILHQIFLI